jgi:hypothetical protein
VVELADVSAQVEAFLVNSKRVKSDPLMSSPDESIQVKNKPWVYRLGFCFVSVLGLIYASHLIHTHHIAPRLDNPIQVLNSPWI